MPNDPAVRRVRPPVTNIGSLCRHSSPAAFQTLVVLPLLVATLSAHASAQENYEIQVYPSTTAAPRTTLFELHSNFTGSGSTLRAGRVLPTNHALHETLEITHGFSDIFEAGFYLFASENPGEGVQFVGTHIRPRIRAPESWGLPVGLSLSTEFGPTDAKFDANAWGMELRPIVDQQRGDLYWAFNPNLAWALKGPDAGQGLLGVSVNPSPKLTWKVRPKYAATLDFFLAPEWELNIGFGVLVAGRGDENILKVIFGRRLDF